jgi:hypothetical protein
MDVDPDKEALFNEVYDTEHLPNLLKVPGVHAVSRMEGESFVMSIGGEDRTVTHDGPRHSAIYEIDVPHVLASREWAKAVEAGRWPTAPEAAEATTVSPGLGWPTSRSASVTPAAGRMRSNSAKGLA